MASKFKFLWCRKRSLKKKQKKKEACKKMVEGTYSGGKAQDKSLVEQNPLGSKRTELSSHPEKEYAGTPLFMDLTDNSLTDELSNPNNNEETPHTENSPNTTRNSRHGSNILISWANPVFVNSQRLPKTNNTSYQAVKNASENKATRKSSPALRPSRRGSSYGAEETLSDRWSNKNLQHVRELWSLTDLQFEQLQSMQEKLADISHWKNNPYELVRFVTGPQGYEQAEELFRAMVTWRLENNIDNLLDEYKPPKILYDHLPSAILQGYDKEGDPIYLERGGAIDGYGLLSRYGEEKCLKHVMWSRELASRGRWIEEFERVQGRPPTRLTIIYDLQGLCSRHMKPGVLPFLRHSLQLTQQKYNGLAKRFIIIRAPSLFSLAWGMCKHAFPKNAQKKMIITSPSNYLEVLEKYVDLDVLPPCVYPEGKGTVAIDMPPRLDGGLIPDDISESDDYEVDPGFDTASLDSLSSVSCAEEESVSPAKACVVRCENGTIKGCWDEVNATSRSPFKVYCWREIDTRNKSYGA